ncbi:ATP-binding protein [Paenibacillus algorifonticola]|uniref:AAA family ATPase n=1 Tax=Paenibacillus algorifonticola TaxID=684063 RepID=UPI003D2B0592
MLLEFRAKNYKTFQDELVFSMIPAPKQKGLDYSILSEKIGSKTYKALSSAVIYGPNASGKSNIIGAMEVLKSILLNGYIRNGNGESVANAAVNLLELIPNNTFEERSPVCFSITFIESGLFFEYKLSLDLGVFLDASSKRKILSEMLTVNGKSVFSREGSLQFGDFKMIKSYFIDDFEAEFLTVAMALAKKNLHDEELFLMNGFKAMFSTELVSIISKWFDKKFMVYYRADAIQLTKKFPDNKRRTIYVDKSMNEAARVFGLHSNAIGYITQEEDSEPELYSLLDKENAIRAEIFESYGTLRFLNIFPIIVNCLLNGGTLVIDEFDASLHPVALISIINLFHNDDLNKKNAQLIFNTHNPIFLNPNVFRRDEIKFVEREDITNGSKHYSLSDFGSSGEKGVRKHEDYMKNYFVSQYGAIHDIDFTPVIENLLQDRDEG